MDRKKTRRHRPEVRTKQTRGGWKRRVWPGLSLAVVIALQIASAWGRLDVPFLDTRLHYSYDNADFGFKMRNGIRNGDLRSQFGVTVNAYGDWGERTGQPSYYTDHPFFLKALLQLYGRIAGVSEWTTRSFYLFVAMLTAAGFHWILLQTTGNLFSSTAGAATLVTLPLFAVYQTCVKFEADGMLLAVWIFVLFVACLRRQSRSLRLLYAFLVAAAFVTHWTAILFVGCLGVYQLLLRNRHPRALELFRTTVLASVAGLVAVLGLMSYLQYVWTGAMGPLLRSFAVRSASIPLNIWTGRQLVYLQQNFTAPVALVCAAMLWLFSSHLWRSRRNSMATQETPGPDGLTLLAGFIAITSAVGILWVVAFRQGSFVHIYWQYWLCLPIGALVAGAMTVTETRWRNPGIWRVLACVLVVWLFASAQRAFSGIAADQLGTPADIEFLRSIRADPFDRLVFVPVTDTALTQWFQGPLFLYYTDRPIAVATRPDEVRRGDKLLVLRYQQRPAVVSAIEGWSGAQLANEKCGPRICAYDITF
ncbi:MAG: glycosyltransferase family 39 protein [Acidobacteriota bacterium]